MKKILLIALLSVASTLSSYAGIVYWGSITDAQTAYTPFNDNVPSTFTGYAYLFLLTGSGSTVSWNSGTGTWDLNGAEQLAFSSAGTLEATPGTWGNMDGATIDDSKISKTFYYQVVLTTVTGNSTLSPVNSGYWASTGSKLLIGYNDIGGIDKSGSATWQNTSPAGVAGWAPVAAVPEPATMALFGLGGLALVIRRKLRKEA